MSQHFRKLSSFLITVLLLCSCDPQKDALALFTNQGLTVLKPARDYVALGGIFVIPHGGTPVYLDPYDSLPPTDASAFHATIMQQSSSSSFGLDAAVGTLGGLVPIPAGLKFSHSKQVQLAQTDTTGTRYTSQMIAGIIKMPSTSAAIQGQLPPGGHNRVFIVQELYTGKSLSLKSSANDGLAASVEGAATIPNCSSTTSSDSTGKSGTTGTGTTGTGTTGTGATGTGTTGATGTGTTGTGTTGAAGTGTTGTGTTGAGTKTGASSTSNVGISVGACWSDAATLSFKSDTAIPFAVRLNEIVLGPDKKTLQVKVTGFKLPNTALGGEDVAATVRISSDKFNGLVHQPH
jgi:hypothetical protein